MTCSGLSLACRHLPCGRALHGRPVKELQRASNAQFEGERIGAGAPNRAGTARRSETLGSVIAASYPADLPSSRGQLHGRQRGRRRHGRTVGHGQTLVWFGGSVGCAWRRPANWARRSPRANSTVSSSSRTRRCRTEVKWTCKRSAARNRARCLSRLLRRGSGHAGCRTAGRGPCQ